MTRLLGFLTLIFIVVSCNGNKDENLVEAGELSKEDIESIAKTSESNFDEIEYVGTFKGEVSGKEVMLILSEDSFKLVVGENNTKGKIIRLDDGSKFELVADKSLFVKYLEWSDIDLLEVLDEEGNYPEDESKEAFLTKQ